MNQIPIIVGDGQALVKARETIDDNSVTDAELLTIGVAELQVFIYFNL